MMEYPLMDSSILAFKFAFKHTLELALKNDS